MQAFECARTLGHASIGEKETLHNAQRAQLRQIAKMFESHSCDFQLSEHQVPQFDQGWQRRERFVGEIVYHLQRQRLVVLTSARSLFQITKMFF